MHDKAFCETWKLALYYQSVQIINFTYFVPTIKSI